MARAEAELAIRQIGTNALPILLAWISKRDSPAKHEMRKRLPLDNRVAFRMRSRIGLYFADESRAMTTSACGVLKATAKPAVPRLSVLLRNPDPGIRDSAAFALCQIGPAAKEAVPALLESLADAAARNNAFAALRSIGAHPEVVVPVLVGHLSSTNRDQQLSALFCLSRLGPNSRAAVPVLVTALSNSDPDLRCGASNALRRIDPEAAVKAGVTLESDVAFSPDR